MKNERIVLAVIGATLIAGSGAEASPLADSLRAQAANSTTLTLTREQLVDQGIDVDNFKNLSGEVRSLLPNELVKVELHEENSAINFSSFDNFSSTVLSEGALCPRNIDVAQQ